MGPERQHTAIGEAAPPVTAASTMRAVVQDGYGSVGVLSLARIARPEPGASEVLLQVHAAGSGPGPVAPDDGPALPDAPGCRFPRAEEPGNGA